MLINKNTKENTLLSLSKLYGQALGNQHETNPTIANLLAKSVQIAKEQEVGIFAYGSLMWSCGFTPKYIAKAKIHGYSRQACIWSSHYRGTVAKPGLVLGLDQGGSCNGLLLGIPKAQQKDIMTKIFIREMFQGVYYPIILKVKNLEANQKDKLALTFVANKKSQAYAKKMSKQKTQQVINTACGQRGKCIDYWVETEKKLKDLGFKFEY